VAADEPGSACYQDPPAAHAPHSALCRGSARSSCAGYEIGWTALYRAAAIPTGQVSNPSKIGIAYLPTTFRGTSRSKFAPVKIKGISFPSRLAFLATI
jgi:hypothetical protein